MEDDEIKISVIKEGWAVDYSPVSGERHIMKFDDLREMTRFVQDYFDWSRPELDTLSP